MRVPARLCICACILPCAILQSDMPCATTRACVQGAVVKLNAAAVLREDALFKKKQEKEAAIIKARTRARAGGGICVPRGCV